jgi:hypothetical protein
MRKAYDSDILRDIEERKELPDATPEELEHAEKATRFGRMAGIIMMIITAIMVATCTTRQFLGL